MMMGLMRSWLVGGLLAAVLTGSPIRAAAYAPLAQGPDSGAATAGSTLDPAISPNQHARVDIMDPLAPVDATGAGQVLQNILLTLPGDPGDSNNPTAAYATISAFVPGGRTIRLRFAEVDNQFFFNFGVDDCSLVVPGTGDVLLNGSFETNGGAGTNSFANWTVYNEPGFDGDFYVQTGTGSPENGFPVPPPTAGSFAAMSDQQGPGLHILYQDVFIPAAGAQLTCDVFVGSQSPFVVPEATAPTGVPVLGSLGLVALIVVLLGLSRGALRRGAPR